MEKMFGELVGFALVGIIFAVIAFLLNLAKASLFGTNLSSKEQKEVKEFKDSLATTSPKQQTDDNIKQQNLVNDRIEAFKNEHPLSK